MIRLIKENHYCETYRVEDEKEEPFFLKLFILKNTPEKMLDENHKVISIGVLAKLRHKNIISYVEHGVYQDDAVGECEYIVTNYFCGELLADKLQRAFLSSRIVFSCNVGVAFCFHTYPNEKLWRNFRRKDLFST